jgi:hypothetical protein
MNEQITKEAQETKEPRNAGRIRRAVEEYNRRFPALTDHNFRLSDYDEIKTLALEDHPAFDPPRMVLFALEAGFMRGYRRAQRDTRKKRAELNAQIKARQDGHTVAAPEPDSFREWITERITEQLETADNGALEFVNAFLASGTK